MNTSGVAINTPSINPPSSSSNWIVYLGVFVIFVILAVIIYQQIPIAANQKGITYETTTPVITTTPVPIGATTTTPAPVTTTPVPTTTPATTTTTPDPATISLADFQIASIPLSGKDAICYQCKGISPNADVWPCYPSYTSNDWQNWSLYSDKTIQNSQFPGLCLNQDFSASACNGSTNQQWIKSANNLLTNVGTSSVTAQLIPKTMMTTGMDSTGDISAFTGGQTAAYCRQLCAATPNCKSSNYVKANGPWGIKSGCVLKSGDTKTENTGVDLYTYT